MQKQIYNEKIEAICLTLGSDFINKWYPGGEKIIRHYLERMNEVDHYNWFQFCGSGIPKISVAYCYIVFNGNIQYRCDIKEFIKNDSGEFYDGGVTRVYENRNLCVLQGPTIPAPYDIPMKGFQGFRYSPFLF